VGMSISGANAQQGAPLKGYLNLNLLHYSYWHFRANKNTMCVHSSGCYQTLNNRVTVAEITPVLT